MAGLGLDTLTDKLSAIVADKVQQEVSVAINFKADFESILVDVIAVKSLLNDVGDESSSDSVNIWLKKLREFARDAQGIVMQCEEDKKELGNNFFCSPFFNYRMGRRIRKLKERIRDIHETGNKYMNLVSQIKSTHESVHGNNSEEEYNSEDERNKDSSFPSENQTVGMQKDIDIITEKILEEDSEKVSGKDKCNPRVIAVVSMGGLGKTLLVHHVIQNEKVKNRFDHIVWLSVGQKFKVRKLVLQVAKKIQLPQNAQENVDELKGRIHSHLQGKCCLFVLDDVWHEGIKTDTLERIGLTQRTSQEINNDKIVVTTRDKRVSDVMRANYTHRMNCLSDENSLQLFCIHAFNERKLPKEQEDFREVILKKISRVPLAIKAIATAIEGQNMIPNDWRAAFNRLDGEKVMDAHVMPTLRSSYQALPNNLKYCFRYFSLFPPNTPIKSEYLVHAWIAEELASVDPHRDDAYDGPSTCIAELFNQCVIQVSPGGSNGRVKYSEMQDLFHHLAVCESLKEVTCLIKPAKELSKLPVRAECQGAQRISLNRNHLSGTIDKAMVVQCRRLRTLLLHENANLASISSNLFNNLRNLAVLDLSETGIKSLPSSIGNLEGLKFLKLSRTNIVKLPKSMSRLQSLQYLDVSECMHLQRLHSGIGDHKSMLYLSVKRCKNLEMLPAGISELRYLRTLKLKGVVLNGEDTDYVFHFRDFKSLTLLQHLSVTFNHEAISSPSNFLNLWMWQDMTKMRAFSLEYVPLFDERCTVPMDLAFMKHLEILRLHKCKMPPPQKMVQLQNLMVLVVDNDDCFSEHHYRDLERIPHLKKLRLSNNGKCDALPEAFGGPHAFPQLETFIIQNFCCLRCFPSLHQKAMPSLKHLKIENCKSLNSIPAGLERTSLELELDSHLQEELMKGQLKTSLESHEDVFEEAMSELPPSDEDVFEEAMSELPASDNYNK